MYICTVVQVQSAFPRTSPNSKQRPREKKSTSYTPTKIERPISYGEMELSQYR